MSMNPQLFDIGLELHRLAALNDLRTRLQRTETTQAIQDLTNEVKKSYYTIAIVSGLFNLGAGILGIGGAFSSKKTSKMLEGIGGICNAGSRSTESAEQGMIQRDQALSQETGTIRSQLERDEERNEQLRRSMIQSLEQILRSLYEAHRISS